MAGATKGAATVIVIIIAAVTVAVAAVIAVAVFIVDAVVAIDAAVSSAPLLVDYCMCPPPSLCPRRRCHCRRHRHRHRSRRHPHHRCHRRCCHRPRPRRHHRHSCHCRRHRLRSHHHRHCDIELPWLKSRRWCPVDVGIEVNLFLFKFNWTIISYKLTATKELFPSIGLDLEAKSCIRRQASNDEKRLILVGVQMEATGQVTAMVIDCIEQKPERLCAGDEFEEVGYVVQKGLRTRRHHKD